MHVESGAREKGGVGGVTERLECLGCIFPSNGKQVTVHCTAIWLMGSGERKKREEGKLE